MSATIHHLPHRASTDDGPKSMAQLCKSSVGKLARKAAADLEQSAPLPIPTIPLSCVECNDAWLAEKRIANRDTDDGLVAEYTAWEVARANAIAANESRLRGLLWTYRALRAEYERSKAPEDALMGRRVAAYLQHAWGISEPPAGRVESDLLAKRTVAKMVRP